MALGRVCEDWWDCDFHAMTMQRIRPEMQTGIADCGAACLSMILGYYGIRRTPSEITDALGAGRDGTSALSLIRTSRRFGLHAKAVRRPGSDVIAAKTGFPGIAHWDGNHFVVVEKADSQRVRIVDPATGRRSIDRSEFEDHYSGVYLEYTRGTIHRGDRQARESKPLLSREVIFTYLRHHSGTLLTMLLMSVLVQAAGICVPLLSGMLVDRVIPNRDQSLHLVVLVATALGLTGYLVLCWVRLEMMLRVHRVLDRQLTGAAVAHLLRLPLSYFLTRGTSDVVQRIGSIVAVREMLGSQVIATLFDGPLVLVYLFVVFDRSWQLGLTLVACMFLQVATIAFGNRLTIVRSKQELATRAAADGLLIESVSAIETVKASGLEAQIGAKWLKLFDRSLQRSIASARIESFVQILVSSLQLTAPAALIWVGTAQVLAGSQTLGQMIATTTLCIAALIPTASLAGTAQRIQISSAHLSRIRDILYAPTESADGNVIAPELAGNISLQDVSFRYSAESPWVLENIDLDIPAGSTVALVGRSGAGKSTLARVLLGLFPPTAGCVRFDGVDASQYEITSLRKQFGVVTQNAGLFTGTIADNIALSQPGATRTAIMSAAKTAAIEADIVRMPMAYDTVLREGDGLSGGQRQRVAIARAILPNPAILLLDEATNALDSETENAVVSNIEKLGITRIVIAHRLTTIVSADLILVVQDGRITERGTHRDLVDRNSHYAQLFQSAAEADVR